MLGTSMTSLPEVAFVPIFGPEMPNACNVRNGVERLVMDVDVIESPDCRNIELVPVTLSPSEKPPEDVSAISAAVICTPDRVVILFPVPMFGALKENVAPALLL